MNLSAKSFTRVLILTTFLLPAVAHAQNSVTANQPASSVTILDSTKAQDGLSGSVRRVKIESAKLEPKNGQFVEGPRQLVEVTTYDVSGKRIENVSYPVASSPVGKEEYKYDDRGNMVEMTMRGDDGSILSKETYAYEFDRFGNWTKMVTSLVLFEGGELKQEPVEVTYRSLTYYFDDSVAKMVNVPDRANPKMPVIPSASGSRISLESGPRKLAIGEPSSSSTVAMSEPPPEAAKTPEVNRKNGKRADDVRDRDSANTAAPSFQPVTKMSEEKSQPVTPSRENENPSPTTSSAPANPPTVEKGEGNVATSTVSPTQKDAFEAYKTGRSLFEMGEAKGAVAAYLNSIKLEPKSAEVHLSLGQAYLKLKKDREATQAFKEALELNPDLAEAEYGLGFASFRMGRHRDAANAFKRAIEMRPEMAKAHYGLALAYQELRNDDGVIEQYRILQGLDRDLAKQLARAFPDFDLPCRVPPFCK
ncbi:MAG TPA: tetratricopeptide repeat protein [Pyrinomonadaceae bacterium]